MLLEDSYLSLQYMREIFVTDFPETSKWPTIKKSLPTELHSGKKNKHKKLKITAMLSSR